MGKQCDALPDLSRSLQVGGRNVVALSEIQFCDGCRFNEYAYS